MAKSQQTLWRLDSAQLSCNYLECNRAFTEERRGKACAGCKRALYCNAQCQKKAWSQHKSACKDRQRAIKEADPSTPLKDRRVPITEHLRHFVGMTSYGARIMGRSALKLGHADSLEKDHFLFMELVYKIPPVERWELTSAKPVGDEKEFFAVKSISVKPDSFLDKLKDVGAISPARKKQFLETSLRKWKDKGFSAFFFFAYCATPDFLYEASTSEGYIIPHFHLLHSLTFAERRLNPSWESIFTFTIGQKAATSKEESDKGNYRLDCIDLAMSETRDTLEALDMPKPRGGWEALYEWLDEAQRLYDQAQEKNAVKNE